ncbi:ras-related protein Rab-44 isoform 3-T3 [Sarcophilus harrisii]
MQADTWKVSAKEIPHPGLPPAGSEQEVGSWGKEVFTLGSDVPVESPEHLVLIEEGIPMMEKEREKMNTEGWEMETNQQNNVRGLETELRESAGSVVSEVPGEESKSTESPGPDAGEILGEGYRSTESPGPDADEILGEGSQSTELPGPDVGEVPREESRNVELPGPDVGEVPREESRNVELPGPDAGEILGEGYRSTESPGPDDGEVLVEDSRFTKSPGPDVENALSQKAELTDSPGPDIGNPDAQETSHVVSSRTVVDSVLSQEEQILRSLESDVEKVPGQKSQLIHLVRVIELPGTVIGNATEKKSELMMSPRQDTDNAFGQKEGMDVGNVLCEEAGILESAELERDNHPGPEIGLLSSSSPDVDVYPSYEVTLLKSYQPGVGDTTELHRLTVRNASDHEARIRISPEIDTSSQEAGLTGSPGPDEDDISGHRTRFMESWKTDIKDASGKEAQVLYSPEPEVGETFRQENVFMSSLGPDRADVTGQKAGTGIGDAAIQEARTTELCKDDVRNASDQGSELMESPELHVDDTVSQENGFIQSDKTDTEKISEQEVEILYSSGLDSSNAPGQGAGYIESPGSDVSDVAVQKAGLMNSSVIDSADSPSQEDKLMLPEKEVSLSAIQKSDVESGLDVGNSPSQETRHDIGGTFLYSPGPDTGDTLSQETRHTEPTMMDVDDATVQRPGVIELSKVDVGNVSDQENRLIKSSGIDAPIGKIELVEFSGPEMGDALSREVKFEGLCEMDVGDVEMAEIMYSPVPDIRDSLGQKSGVVELHGLCVSEISIQQARVLESDVRDGPGQGIMPKEFHEADVGNASAQDTEIMHSPRPGVRDSAGLEAETVHSPGPYVGDSIGQEAGVPELDVGNAPDQETRFMPSCETHVSGACEEEAEILHSPGPDEEDSPGQEERGGLQDQNSEAVWRAEDGVLQRQAREGFWLPKDSPGDTLGTQDAGQALSVPLEAEAQPECKVLGGQIIPLSEPREENSLEVMKKANLKSQVQATRVSPGGEAPEPDYLFHVLFLGDSNVGKTSFLHLLHHDSFATGLTATVGMDYRIKNLMVDNRWFALQLWDTAGQERYHSITKQFLRKADGIVLMYDVTCPGSFTHVRYWLDCIQERGPDDVVILLLGNKIDCVKERLVSTEAGQLLAKEIGVIFGECSAVLGHNILEPIMSLARAMQEQDTKMKHSVVKLEKKEVKKAGCCS